jgi:hypothetical protein
MRAAAGKYLGSLIDYYIAHQTILNAIVVILGFSWIVYRNKHGLRKNDHRKNFFGLEMPKNKNGI